MCNPVETDQAAVTLGETEGEIGGLTISDPPTQVEVQTLRDKCEELADDARALSTLVHALRGALVATGIVKVGPYTDRLRCSSAGTPCGTTTSK